MSGKLTMQSFREASKAFLTASSSSSAYSNYWLLGLTNILSIRQRKKDALRWWKGIVHRNYSLLNPFQKRIKEVAKKLRLSLALFRTRM